ncbi:MAG TPA: rRNA adenine N-6-methyltransferase family protein [Beijerinckiaceae bacterium]|nr:rRNA adenine N-6-methyltransferase family protein [Beijerinckiaceae bacterium]
MLDFKLKKPDFKLKKPDIKLDDEAKFLKSWLNNPIKTGAVSPSGKALAAVMAEAVDPTLAGPVIELGPGTGPVTEALIDNGIAENRLVLVEYNAEFCALLRKRFPEARVVQGDAYALKDTLGNVLNEPAAAIVSSLPLVTKPDAECLKLVFQGFDLMLPGAPFVQFTYGPVSPVPVKGRGFKATVSKRVWLNLPPARVWTYRRFKVG